MTLTGKRNSCLVLTNIKIQKNYIVDKNLNNIRIKSNDLTIRYEHLALDSKYANDKNTYFYDQFETDVPTISVRSHIKIIKNYLSNCFNIQTCQYSLNNNKKDTIKKMFKYIGSKKHKNIKVSGIIEISTIDSKNIKSPKTVFFDKKYRINATLCLNPDTSTTIKALNIKILTK